MLLELLVGFNAAINLLIGVGVAYTLWRYAFKPFEALKKSCQDLATALQTESVKRLELEQWVKSEFGLRKALVLDDETVARAEARLRARAAWSSSGSA